MAGTTLRFMSKLKKSRCFLGAGCKQSQIAITARSEEASIFESEYKLKTLAKILKNLYY